jgi:hypothetical protein
VGLNVFWREPDKLQEWF